jgi:TRAP-type C4-dicarboxylate transport system substrate-binding protein
MPVPALPQALSKGTVDGALVPFEIVAPLKLHQLTDVSVEGADGNRFGTSVFLYAMNKERYQELPAELQKVIDETTDRAFAEEMGELWNSVEQTGKDLQRESGGKVIQLTPKQTQAFNDITHAVTQRWIDQANERGIEGEALVEAAKQAIEKHEGGGS